jgi:predicted  nucleic acid-binding Zn-ribbon protein
MLTDDFKKLLILQDKDLHVRSIEADLKSYPQDKKQLLAKKEALIQQFEKAKNELKVLEVKMNERAGTIAELRAKRIKYKTQQIEVKRNEDLQALEQEILKIQQNISDIEDEEIQLMIELEDGKEDLKSFEETMTTDIAQYEDELLVLNDREKESEGHLNEARKDFDAANSDLSQKFVRAYEHVKRQVRRAPFIVELQGVTCSECHLKVSNEAQSSARDTSLITHCDQCNRILYK